MGKIIWNGYEISWEELDWCGGRSPKKLLFRIYNDTEEKSVIVGISKTLENVWELKENLYEYLAQLGVLKVKLMILRNSYEEEFLFTRPNNKETLEKTIKNLEEEILKEREKSSRIGFIKDS